MTQLDNETSVDDTDALIAELEADGGGGFQLGTLHLALPLSALREVVNLTTLRCVPCQVAGLIGAIDLRGALLPVLDLRQLLCRQPNEAAHPCVVVMVHQGRLLGLLADQVTGTFQCAPRGTHRVRGSGLSNLFAASVRRERDDELVNLLSPRALAELPGLPMIEDPEPERSAVTSHGDVESSLIASRSLILLRLGRQMLAIDALAVDSTSAAPHIQDSALALGACRGVVESMGRRLPAVDLADYCGLGPSITAAHAANGDMLVVKAMNGFVGLLVDAVTDVVAVASESVVRIPAMALPRSGLFAGSLPASALPTSSRTRLPNACDQLMVLDSLNLARQLDLQALAAAAATKPADRNASQMRAHPLATPEAVDSCEPTQGLLVFGLQGEWCVALHQVGEILALTDQELTPAPRPSATGMLGLVSDRGRVIPVLDLALLLGETPDPALPVQAALLVKLADDWIGFAVHQLKSIEAGGRRRNLPRRGAHPSDQASVVHVHQLVELGSGVESRLVRLLDLEALTLQLSVSNNLTSNYRAE